MADPDTYADPAKTLTLTQQYQQEQAAQEALYDALEQAEAAYEDAAQDA